MCVSLLAILSTQARICPVLPCKLQYNLIGLFFEYASHVKKWLRRNTIITIPRGGQGQAEQREAYKLHLSKIHLLYLLHL